MKVQVLSPDGITIEFDKWSYPSNKKAKEAFNKWKSYYERQGYYSSSTHGKICLDKLAYYCKFKTI